MATWEYTNLSTDVALRLHRGSVSIWSAQPCNLATFKANAVDRLAALDIQKGHRVRARYADDDVTFTTEFEGDVIDIDWDHLADPNPDPRRWGFSAQDYTARLDWTVIASGDRQVTETVTERVLWIMGIAPLHGIGTAHVASIATEIGPDDYTGLTRMAALNKVKQFCLGLFYVDWEPEDADANVGELHFFSQDDPEVVPAPFDLAYPSSAPTSYGYSGYSLGGESGIPPNEVIVIGDNVTATVTDGTDPDEPIQRVISNKEIRTLDQAEAIGQLALSMWAGDNRNGRLRMRHPGLRSGMTVNISNALWPDADGDYIITSVRPIQIIGNTADHPEYGSGGYTEYDVEFASTYACKSSLEDIINGLLKPPPDDGSDCGRALVLLPSGMTSDLSITTGGQSGQIFAYDGADTLVKYREDLQTKVWASTSAPGESHIATHQPGTYVPVNIGSRAYRRDNGDEEWNIEAQISVLAAHVQDRRRFWLTGTPVSATPAFVAYDHKNGTTAIALPGAYQVGDLAIVMVRGAAGALTVPAGWTAIGSDATAGLRTGVAYKFIASGETTAAAWVNQSSISVLILRDAAAPGSATGNHATTQPVNFAAATGGLTVAFIATASGAVDTVAIAGMTNRSSGADPSFHLAGCATKAGNFAGTTYTGGGVHLRTWTVGVSGTVSGGGGSSVTGKVLQTRESDTGAFVATTDLDDDGDEIRTPSSEQTVYVKQGTDTIEAYDRDLGADGTTTITDFFPADDWGVDDAGSLYQLLGNVLTKYGSDGVAKWDKDLNALYDYNFPADGITLGHGTGQQVLVDDFIHVAGWTGGSDWTDAGTEAYLLTLARSDGSLKMRQRFGGGSGDSAMAIAVHKHVALGCIYMAGIAQGGEFEGLSLSAGTNGWLMRVGTTGGLDTAGETSGTSGAPTTIDYLVGTATPDLSGEIVAGTTPGGELGGTWGSPTVDTTHSGSSHAGLSGQPGSTDVAVADGGTGASTAAGARTNLGLGSLATASSLAHAATTGQTANDHHNQAHSIIGADHSAFPGGTSDFLRADGSFATPPSGGAPSGAAGGELAGTYPNPTVAASHSGSAHHTRQHVMANTSDHTFPGGTTTFMRADGSWASPAASGAGGSAKGWVGDGSDGNIVLDGTNTYSFLTKTGNIYQQNRDIFANNLTIDAGKTLQTSQFRTYVLATLTVNGTLTAAGTDAGGASAATAGQAPATVGSPTLGGGQDGGAGRTNSAGVGTSTANAPTSTAGGRGGSGGSATSAGGTAGTVGPTAGGANWRSLPWAVMGTMSPTTAVSGFTLLKGGTGGGSGGSNSSTTTVSGGGGGGAGVMIVCATTIIVGAAGVITAAGGNGATATGTGAAGGGGGGGGGAMVLLYEAYTNSGSVTVAGGVHGNGINGGNNGVDGSGGTLLQFAMA